VTSSSAPSLDRNAIPIETADPLELAWFELSDLGNAMRLEAVAAGTLKWVEDEQLWAAFDGRRFDTERGAITAQRLAFEVIRHLMAEAKALDRLAAEGEEALAKYRGGSVTPASAKAQALALRKHAVKSGAASATAGMLRQARPFLAVLSEEFDADPLAYNVRNGTLRFVPPGSAPHSRTDPESRGDAGKGGPADPGGWSVSFSPHDPADMLTRMAEVEYDPAADAPQWRARLARLTPDPEQLAAFQRLYGYTLTGLTSDQAFYVHQGKGNDGKSTTHQELAELHGDYYRHAGVNTFLQGPQRGGAEHRSDLVRLKGDVRFVTCDEPKPRSVWDGETIKQVTGSLITARGSGEKTEVTYRPRFKAHVECNIIPNAPSDDKGFRRRFKLYQWTVSLPTPGQEGYEPIDVVLGRLKAERSGILNWLIAGCLDWLDTREIPQPAAMTAVLGDFWASSSPVAEWMAEWCDTSDPAAMEPVDELWKHFSEWKERNGIEAGAKTKTALSNKLRDMQFPPYKDARGIRWRKGIKLRSEALFGPAPPSMGASRAAAGSADDDDCGGLEP
jgi:putative DNA primase/helicase